MKKALSLLTLLALVFALAGCDSIPGTGGASNGGSNAGSGTTGYAEDGYAEGFLGDTMHTDFFDFTVKSASVVSEYNGYTPAEGFELLVAEITVLNTFNESIPMFDSDFQAQWGDDESDDEDTYAYPIEEGYGDVQLPTEYEMAVKESRTGEIVFEVPAGHKDFSVSHQVFYDDDTTGDTFFIFFTADKGSTAA